MVNPLTLLLLLIALLAGAGSAAAQPAPAPRFTVGDRWAFTDGRLITVVKLDDGGPVMTGALRACATCNVYYDKNLAIRKVTDGADKPMESAKLGFLPLGPAWKFYEFPLEVKKTWKFSAEGLVGGKPERYDVAVVVTALEDVKTKAGTFKAYKMERTWRGASAGTPFHFTDVVWFAPSAKYPVKFESNRQGAQGGELSSYALK